MNRLSLKNRIPSSYLFLMELLLALLLFAVAAAASLVIFVRSHNLSSDASALGFAAEDLSSLSELIRSSATYVDVLDRAAAEYPHAELTDSSIVVCFNEQNEETDAADARFRMCALLSMEDGMLHADMAFTDDPEADLMSLTASADPEETADGLTAALSIDHYVREGAL